MQRPRGRRAWPVGGKEEGGRSGPGAGRGDPGARDPETGGPRGGWGGFEGTSCLGRGQNSLDQGVGRTDKRSCAFCSRNSTSKAKVS